MSEVLKESKVKEAPYSHTPITKCPRGGLHKGSILDKCPKCKKLLVFADFELQVSAGLLHIIKCIDCGASREVKPQDVWQVKRCKPCQAKKTKKSFTKFMRKVQKK